MESVLISRETLAKRWEVSVSTINKYEVDGVIQRVPNIPSPRYNIEDIKKLEGSELNPMSPLERRRLQIEIGILESENEKLKAIVGNILVESSKIINIIK